MHDRPAGIIRKTGPLYCRAWWNNDHLPGGKRDWLMTRRQGADRSDSKPDNKNRYRQFPTSGVLLYVEEDLLANLPYDRDCFKLFMGDYGRWRIRVQRHNQSNPDAFMGAYTEKKILQAGRCVQRHRRLMHG